MVDVRCCAGDAVRQESSRWLECCGGLVNLADVHRIHLTISRQASHTTRVRSVHKPSTQDTAVHPPASSLCNMAASTTCGDRGDRPSSLCLNTSVQHYAHLHCTSARLSTNGRTSYHSLRIQPASQAGLQGGRVGAGRGQEQRTDLEAGGVCKR